MERSCVRRSRSGVGPRSTTPVYGDTSGKTSSGWPPRCDWDALRTRRPPPRGQVASTVAPAGPTKPAWLYEFLVHVVHMEAEEALALVLMRR